MKKILILTLVLCSFLFFGCSKKDDEITKIKNEIKEIKNKIQETSNKIEEYEEENIYEDSELLAFRNGLEEYVNPRICKIIHYKNSKPDSYGSGFIIDKDKFYLYILTNAHVVNGDNNITNIKLQFSTETVSGQVIYLSMDYDMALVRVPFKYFTKLTNFDYYEYYKPFEIAPSNPKINDIVFIAGNPHYMSFSISMGKILRYSKVSLVKNEEKYEYDCVDFDCFALPGSSGSVLFNLEKQVVGIVTWGVEGSTFDNQSIGMASYVSLILNFLEEAKHPL